MKALKLRYTIPVVMASLGLKLGATQQTPAPAKTTRVTTNAVAVVAEPEIPKSVFIYPRTPKDGRNPFFPDSNTGMEQPKAKEAAVDPMSLVLNGITSPPRRTAMINGRTFEPGESGEIRLPGGKKLLITCYEIREGSAVITIGNERRELRLRSGI